MDYRAINRAAWNRRTALHLDSDFYDMAGFLSGKTSLREIELNLLGEVQGLDLLHLQCHFGQDSLSLARMGAQVTGVDLSDVAIREARRLNDQLGLSAQFVCSDLYELVLPAEFDLVFTSYGTIGWLPDLDRWAQVVATHLRPGGRFVFVEFHPVVWMFDDDFQQIVYRYFTSDPIVEESQGSYARPDAGETLASVSWNHGLAEVVQALLQQGLILQDMQEYDFSPYDVFTGGEAVGENRYQIAKFGDKLPMIYSLVMTKPG